MSRGLVLLAALAACGETTQPPGNGVPVETDEVTVVDNAFEPASIIVTAGDTVTWTFAGFDAHSVVFDSPTIPSSAPQAVGTYRAIVSLPGTFTYFCSVHGRSVMAGQIEVRPEDPEPRGELGAGSGELYPP